MKCNACSKQFFCDRKQCNFKSFLEVKDYGRPKRLPVEIEIGDVVRHKKDKFMGTVKSVDKVFIHLEDGRSMLKHYAEIVKEKINNESI